MRVEPLPWQYTNNIDCDGFGTDTYTNGILLVSVSRKYRFLRGNLYAYFLRGRAKFLRMGSNKLSVFATLNLIGYGDLVFRSILDP